MASQRFIWFTAPALRLPPSPAGTLCGFSLATPGPADANQRDHPLVRFTLLQGVALAPLALLLSERASCGFQLLFSAMRQTGYTSKGTTPWSHSRRPRFLTALAGIAFQSIRPGLVSSRKHS
jgi:hypothetical protein